MDNKYCRNIDEEELEMGLVVGIWWRESRFRHADFVKNEGPRERDKVVHMRRETRARECENK